MQSNANFRFSLEEIKDWQGDHSQRWRLVSQGVWTTPRQTPRRLLRALRRSSMFSTESDT